MPYDAQTETPIDWVWGVGFEGRASRPFGRTAPGAGGGGGGPVGAAPTADFEIALPLSGGPDYGFGETVQVTGGWTMAPTVTAGLSNDTDGIILTQDYEVLTTGITVAAGNTANHTRDVVLDLGTAGTLTGIEYIKLTVTDDDGMTANKIVPLNMVPAALIPPTALTMNVIFTDSSGNAFLQAPIFTQVQTDWEDPNGTVHSSYYYST